MKAKKAKALKSKSKKAGKKTTSKPKSAGKRTTKKKTKKLSDLPDDSGIVLIDDDLEIDTEKELEERKAYLEEARSQETSD